MYVGGSLSLSLCVSVVLTRAISLATCVSNAVARSVDITCARCLGSCSSMWGYTTHYGPRDAERDAETEASGQKMSGVGGLTGHRGMPSSAAAAAALASVRDVDEGERARLNRILDGTETPAGIGTQRSWPSMMGMRI